jgi:hypothetical protein
VVTKPPSELEPVRSWLTESLGFYRRLDFFVSPKSDEEVADWILRVHRRRYSDHVGGPLDDLHDERWFFHRDLHLLVFDRRRALFLDFESPSVGGSTMYEYELARFARITRGVFDPTDIDELALDKKRGRDVLVTFRVEGTVKEYVIGGGNHDWIDWKLLWIVQEHLDASPYRLHAAAEPMPAQEVFLVVLRPDEREVISRERGLDFAPLPSEPVDAWEWWWDTG